MYSDSTRLSKALHPGEWCLLIAAVSTILLWRYVPGAWVLIPALGCVIAGSVLRIRLRQRLLTSLLILSMAVVVAPLIAMPTIWPCPVACQGGAAYAQLAGIATWAWGFVAYAICLALGMINYVLVKGELAQICGKLYALGLAACAGVSVWFLGLSWQMELLCNHCLALHGLVLLACCLAWRDRWKHVSALTLGLLLCHALFSIGAAPPPAIQLGSAETRLSAQVEQLDAAMTFGEAEAPFKG